MPSPEVKLFIKKPIYNAFILGSKLGDGLLACEGKRENMSVLATKHEDGGFAVMLAYASQRFNEKLDGVSEELALEGISGKRTVRVWCIDELHTNPYALSLRENIGDNPTGEQIERMREEGILKPLCEYEKNFDTDNTVTVEFTDNALVLVEIV